MQNHLDRVKVVFHPDRMPDMPKNERDRPRRLRRLDEVWTVRGRPIFFVSICTADRRPWLDRPEIHEALVAFCAQSPGRVGAWVGRYVLMPDHVHLFVSVEGPQALSRWVGALKRHLAKVRRETDKEPPEAQPRPTPGLDFVGRPCAGGGIDEFRPTPGGKSKAEQLGRAWQNGFFDHLLRGGESYAEKWNYVRMNPVRAGLVEQPDDWPFAGEIEALRW
jgi:REP element-mobilizing transposase RayT